MCSPFFCLAYGEACSPKPVAYRPLSVKKPCGLLHSNMQGCFFY